MWVRFTSDFDWRRPGFTVAYKAGMERNVTRACADAAIAAGKAKKRGAAKVVEPQEVTDGSD